MKKIIILLLLVTFAGKIHSQRVRGNGNMVTTTRTVGEFSEIFAGGSFDVKLESGNEGDITIYMDENLLDYLITEVRNGELVIKWQKGMNINTRSNILITIPFTDVEAVSLAGSGNLYSNDVVKSDSFKAILSGSGDLKLNVNTHSLKTDVSGSGDIELTGSASVVDGGISGSGKINAYDLSTKEADLSISGSGGIKISVSDNLKARISGSGNIYYKGNPQRQDVKVSGSGNVSGR